MTSGAYRFDQREAKDCAPAWRAVRDIVAGGFAPVSRGSTVADDRQVCRDSHKAVGQEQGGNAGNAEARDFIDRRLASGAGGVTETADLSFLYELLKWAWNARHLDVPDCLALEARAGPKHRGVHPRKERDREPSDYGSMLPSALITHLLQRIGGSRIAATAVVVALHSLEAQGRSTSA